jgi:hypothetical protein
VPYSSYALDKFTDRWEYGDSWFAQAAYVLDPEFMDHDQASNAEVMTGFLNTVERIGILKEVRKKKAAYEDIWKKRRGLISANPKKLDTYEFYPDYPKSDHPEVKAFGSKVGSQLALYRNKKGITGRPSVVLSDQAMPAYLWWDQNGSTTKELQTVARIVLAQPASASIIERINSEFAFIKDKKRNRLGHEKANKLVDVFTIFAFSRGCARLGMWNLQWGTPKATTLWWRAA